MSAHTTDHLTHTALSSDIAALRALPTVHLDALRVAGPSRHAPLPNTSNPPPPPDALAALESFTPTQRASTHGSEPGDDREQHAVYEAHEGALALARAYIVEMAQKADGRGLDDGKLERLDQRVDGVRETGDEVARALAEVAASARGADGL